MHVFGFSFVSKVNHENQDHQLWRYPAYGTLQHIRSGIKVSRKLSLVFGAHWALGFGSDHPGLGFGLNRSSGLAKWNRGLDFGAYWCLGFGSNRGLGWVLQIYSSNFTPWPREKYSPLMCAISRKNLTVRDGTSQRNTV